MSERALQAQRRAAPDTDAPRLRWPVEALWAQLQTLRPGLSVEVAAELDSTSTRLLERARAGDTAPCLLVAERQTAGRGRLGRPWFSDAGDTASAGATGPASLTVSLGLVLAPADWSGLSLAVGVALAESLHASVKLKWPNDLWLTGADGAGRKLGGVLIETQSLPADAAQAGARYAVIGIGINLDAPAARPELTLPAAGWRELEPAARAPELLARLAPPLLGALARFEQEGFAVFARRFKLRDALAGRPVTTTDAGLPQGRADGVDARGALRLLTDGGLRLLTSGEVSVRPC